MNGSKRFLDLRRSEEDPTLAYWRLMMCGTLTRGATDVWLITTLETTRESYRVNLLP